jgi:Mrp family chromosome partitioning ATPase
MHMTVTLPVGSISAPEADGVLGFAARIYRRRRLFYRVFFVTLLPVLAVILLWPPIYLATGAVIIGNQESANSTASAAWIEKLGDPADLQSQLLILQSWRMLRIALARPGVGEAILEECRHRRGNSYLPFLRPNCAKLKPGSQELLDWVGTRYSIKAAGRSRIIEIGYRSQLPEIAFVLANALLIAYVEDLRAENSRSREAASAWLLEMSQRLSPEKVPLAQSSAGEEADAAARWRQNFYQDLHNKASILEAERRVLMTSGRVVSLAEIPRVPQFPKPLPFLAVGFTVAASLAALAAMLRDVNDRTVRSRRELEQLARERVLVAFPRSKQAARIFSGSIGDCPEIDEAGGALFARLMLSADRKSPRCVLIASASEGEGKSSTAMALACAACSGRRVLLVSCDFHRLYGSSDDRAAPGLAEILSGEVTPEQAVTRSAIPSLDLIGAGNVRGSSTMLLVDSDFSKLLHWAECYDLILLDGSSGPEADTAILARHADGVLWCVCWGHTPQSDVKSALDDLRNQGANVLGLVLTMVSPDELKSHGRARPFNIIKWRRTNASSRPADLRR